VLCYVWRVSYCTTIVLTPSCTPLSFILYFFWWVLYYILTIRSGTNLAIIFGSRIVVGQLKQSVLPYIKHRIWVHQGIKEGCSLTRPEKELFLHEVISHIEKQFTSISVSATHNVHIAIFSFFCQSELLFCVNIQTIIFVHSVWPIDVVAGGLCRNRHWIRVRKFPFCTICSSYALHSLSTHILSPSYPQYKYSFPLLFSLLSLICSFFFLLSTQLHFAVCDRPAHRRILWIVGEHCGDQDRRLEIDQFTQTTLSQRLRRHRHLVNVIFVSCVVCFFVCINVKML